MSRAPFTSIAQIGLVVADAETTARRYRELLGVERWYVNQVDTDQGLGLGFRYRARPVETKAKIVWGDCGGVEIELIESQDNSSAYAEFFRERGPGVHHVMFATESFDAAQEQLAAGGLDILAEGVFQGSRFELWDTEPRLGVIVEITEGGVLVPDREL